MTTFQASIGLVARVVLLPFLLLSYLLLPFLLLACLLLPSKSIHDWGTKKECLILKIITKDNLGFLKNLHYYNCSGLLYVNR
jgi:hypothetical protein